MTWINDDCRYPLKETGLKMIWDYDDSLRIEIGIETCDDNSEPEIFIAFHEKAKKEWKIFRGQSTRIFFTRSEVEKIIAELNDNLAKLSTKQFLKK